MVEKSRKRGSGQPVFGLNLMLFNIMKLLDLLECITWFNRIGQNMQNPKFYQNPCLGMVKSLSWAVTKYRVEVGGAVTKYQVGSGVVWYHKVF